MRALVCMQGEKLGRFGGGSTLGLVCASPCEMNQRDLSSDMSYQ